MGFLFSSLTGFMLTGLRYSAVLQSSHL